MDAATAGTRPREQIRRGHVHVRDFKELETDSNNPVIKLDRKSMGKQNTSTKENTSGSGMDHLAVVGVATLGSTGAGGGVTLGLLADEWRSGSSGRFAACTNQGLDAWDWRPAEARGR